MTRADFQALAEERINDAGALLNSRLVSRRTHGSSIFHKNGSRYDSGISEDEAKQMYLRVTDATEGVLPWLRTLW